MAIGCIGPWTLTREPKNGNIAAETKAAPLCKAALNGLRILECGELSRSQEGASGDQGGDGWVVHDFWEVRADRACLLDCYCNYDDC